MEYTIMDFLHILLTLLAIGFVYYAGKHKGASEICEMLLEERIIKTSDLTKLDKKYNE